MKNSVLIVSVLSLGLSVGCQKNDDKAPAEIALQNEPPLSFNLVGVPDDATAVDLTPTLSWESAKNPKGGEVTYDLYLDTDVNPTTLYESTIDGTSFELTERLHLLTDYYWKVVATDVNGKSSQSAVHKFATRNLNFPSEPITEAADFSKRSSHTATVFKDKIWIIGGVGDNGRKNDVWQSDNGLTWKEVTSSAQFSPRRSHATAVFKDKLWVIGGNAGVPDEAENDVWYSDDGLEWIEATSAAAFPPRRGHNVLVFDNKLWVIGGIGSGATNDVWWSDDGVLWHQQIEHAPFSGRLSNSALVFDNKMWVIGGANVTNAFQFEFYDEAWFSTDGINWTKTDPTPRFSSRAGHTAVTYDDKLWVIGGFGVDFAGKNDMWYSSNGIHWAQATEAAPFIERTDHTSLAFDDELWVIAGLTENGPSQDVWAMD